MTSRLELILNAIVQTGPRKDKYIPTYNQGEFYMQLKLCVCVYTHAYVCMCARVCLCICVCM